MSDARCIRFSRTEVVLMDWFQLFYSLLISLKEVSPFVLACVIVVCSLAVVGLALYVVLYSLKR